MSDTTIFMTYASDIRGLRGAGRNEREGVRGDRHGERRERGRGQRGERQREPEGGRHRQAGRRETVRVGGVIDRQIRRQAI